MHIIWWLTILNRLASCVLNRTALLLLFYWREVKLGTLWFPKIHCSSSRWRTHSLSCDFPWLYRLNRVAFLFFYFSRFVLTSVLGYEIMSIKNVYLKTTVSDDVSKKSHVVNFYRAHNVIYHQLFQPNVDDSAPSSRSFFSSVLHFRL